MVLNELASRLQKSFQDLGRSPSVDEKALDAALKEICTALLESDVNVKLVSNLRNKVKNRVLPSLQNEGSGVNKRNLIQRAVFDELVALVDADGSAAALAVTGPSTSAAATSSASAWKPKKGVSNVVMFVGLQGAGKTTSCTKFAVHFQRKGYKTALVCADTFRAGAFDQLKQNATKAKIPFFGSYTETDPVAISAQGVAKFKQERFDVIIVDTSGRHKQETELFEEMKEIQQAVDPNITILVLDGAIGQAAEAQSKAFKDAAGFSGIIVTKMDGHARGGGAISAVAATKTPIMFIGTGEHLHDLERFSPRPFISKLLGMGDVQGLMEQMQDIQSTRDPKKQEAMMKKIEAGIFTIRDMKEQMSTVMSMGPLSKVANMIPGMGAMLNSAPGETDEEMGFKVKKIMFITDSMTTEELDSDGSLFVDSDSSGQPGYGYARPPNARILRVARGSGTTVREVEEVLAQHKMLGAMVKKMGPLAGIMKNAQQGGLPGGKGRGQPSPSQIAALQKMLPAEYQSPDGMAKLRQMAQSSGLIGRDGRPDMAKMNEMQAQMGGLGGMLGGLGGMFGR